MKRYSRDSVSSLFPLPTHVGIIMDGNGRWAKHRGMPRTFGHKEGARRIKLAVDVALEWKIPHLTLFAFSTENWNRPEAEIQYLFDLVPTFFKEYQAELLKKDVAVHLVGFLEELPLTVRETLQEVERQTAQAKSLHLHLAFNYGGHRDLVYAARQLAQAAVDGTVSVTDIDEAMYASKLCSHTLPSLDLVIRTSNEQRLSNFLPWQSAYAELCFLEILWPDFKKETFYQALAEYQSRQRRFGGV